MKTVNIVLAILTLSACSKSGGGDAMANFFKVPTAKFDGGTSLPNGDYYKYHVESNDKIFNIAVESRKNGICTTAHGQLPVPSMGGSDHDGRFYKLPEMRIQIQPKGDQPADYDDRFVHVLIDAPKADTCTGKPDSQISGADFNLQTQRHSYSSFGLSENVLASAKPAFLHASETYMAYFKTQDLGLAMDANTGAVVGIDIPKHRLYSDYLFTVSRPFLKTDDLPASASFPLLLTDADAHSNTEARLLAKALKSIDNLESDPQKRADLKNSLFGHEANPDKPWIPDEKLKFLLKYYLGE